MMNIESLEPDITFGFEENNNARVFFDDGIEKRSGNIIFSKRDCWDDLLETVETDEHEIRSDFKLIDNILDEFSKLRLDFDDLRYRQIQFLDIKETISDHISELWDMNEDDDYFSELLLLLDQALECTKSEELDDLKINVFENTLKRLKEDDIEDKDIEEFGDKFIECGISFIAPISNLSSLYK